MKLTKKVIFSLCLASSLAFGYSNTVYQVQQQLSELGYNVSVDGEMGRGTKRAIREYQEDNGLRVNGRLTKELLNSLGVQRGGTKTTRYTKQTPSTESDEGGFFDSFGGGSLSDSLKNGKYQIGLATSWPSYGFSLKMDYSDKITLELLASPFGTYSTYAAKVNYYISKKRKYNTYVYGIGGMAFYENSYQWNWDTHKYESNTENVATFGGGAGIEWSWRTVLGRDFPNLYSTIEVGYSNISFKYLDVSSITYGGGLYYKF